MTYIAVIFTTQRSADLDGYAEMAGRMDELARQQPGFIGVDSVSDGDRGITISYWVDEAASLAWRQVAEHLLAQRLGRERWYDSYDLRVATVTREHAFRRDGS
ncbi:MAG: antibiotic biosynthesis monooxygenase [Actinobacteria bacterium]|nr:antibiotic biosynthesis monooxygenase [Actinomycetota bacterium]